MVGSRTTCLLCLSESYEDQLDLCADCCLNVSVVVGRFNHTPLHDMVQFRQVVHNRDLPRLVSFAKEAVDRGKFTVKQMPSADAAVDHWTCSWCRDPIQLPCWFCTTCSKETFICDTCNAADAVCKHIDTHPKETVFCNTCDAANAVCRQEDNDTRPEEPFICDACHATNAVGKQERHNDTHPIVRLNKSTVEGSAVESGLLSLETRFKEDWQTMTDRIGRLEQRFEDVIHDRLGALEAKVEARLAKVEGLLHNIAQRLS